MTAVHGLKTLRTVRTIAAGTVLEAWRSQLPWLMAALAAVAAALAAFLHGVALVEAAQTRLALLAALLRLAAAGIVATLAVAGTVREAQDKQAELLLTLPIPRAAWLCGRLAGFAALALLPALLALGFVSFLLPAPALLWQALLWAVTLLCELWIVATFATFCALGLGNVAPALCATFGFYVLARSLAVLQLLGHGTGADPGMRVLTGAADAVAWLLPRLDGFARTEWLLYGTGTLADLGSVLAQTALALLLLVAASLFDLYRRQF